MAYRFLSLLLLLFISLQICGQKLLSRAYTMANGLPSNEVYTILKDKSGYIWIGTDRGLCKFDGATFKLYTTNNGLCENSTLEIKEDKLGRIWCRSFTGLFTVIDKDSVYPLEVNKEILKQKIGNMLYQMEIDDSMNLYIGTRVNSEIYKSSFPYSILNKLLLPKAPLKYLQIDLSKSIASYYMDMSKKFKNNKGVICSNNNTFDFGLKIRMNKHYLFFRYINHNNNFIFTLDEQLYTIPLNQNQPSINPLPFNVSAMEIISDSTCLIGGLQGELAVLNLLNFKYKLLDKLPSSISSIMYNNNTCWISTLKNGVYHIPNFHYSVIHANKEFLISMLPISNNSLLVLNANSEASFINQNNAIRLPTSNNQNSLLYWQHLDHSQKEYIAPVGCFDYIINKTNNNKVIFKQLNRIVGGLLESVIPIDSFIYYSYFGIIMKYNQKQKTTKGIFNSKVRITYMYGNKGIVYIGALNGMYKIINDKVLPLDTHSFLKHRISTIDKLDDDHLVIASQTNGIGIYNLRNKLLTVYNKDLGLDLLNIEYIFVDEEKKIWITTKIGVYVLKNINSKKPILVEVADLMLDDLSIREVRVLNKEVYILAGNKVIKIPEKYIRFNEHAMPFVLNELLINGQKRSVFHLDSLKLNANENNLLLNYQLLSFTNNHQIEYRYKLNNEPWIFTSNNELQLASLPSGNCKITIQGRLKNGIWSKIFILNFTIKQLFYTTIWFKSLGALVGLLAIYFLLSYFFKTKYKKRMLQFELKRELESARLMASKSQMNPHFIFNALNSIQNFVIKSEKIQAYQYLNDFSVLIRSYLQYANKDYIKIDKELELIQTYIKIEQLRIPFEFDLQWANHIKPNEENVFTLLLQPMLENAIWHGLNHQSGAKKLTVFINKQNEKIEINITDNGIGRAQSKIINAERLSKPASVATDNMNSRIASLNMLYKNDIKVKILDNFDANKLASGTTVLISFNTINENN